jgi:hypothetical protein
MIMVDYNTASRGYLTTYLEFADAGTDLSIGSRVMTRDYDGNCCDADVTSIQEDEIILALDLGTFQACSQDVEAYA